MVTLSTICSLLGLALLAAIFAAQGRAIPNTVHWSDRDKFVPWFFRQEKFYRSFVVNLSFAGISLAIVGERPVVTPAFFDWDHASISLVANLLWGILAVALLRDGGDEIVGREWRRVTACLAVALLVFVFTIAASYSRQCAAREQQPCGLLATKTGHE